MSASTDRGTSFAETETLLAALEGDTGEVLQRVDDMFPNERRALAEACELVAGLCRGAS